MQRIFYAIALVFSLNLVYAQYPVIELMEHYSFDDLQGILDDFGIPDGLIEKNFEVDAYKITYLTPHPAPDVDETIVTGVIAVPAGTPCKLPLSCYMHGTTATKDGVPSHGSAELNIGLIFSMIGNVVALPDLIGLGDSPGLHPYHHAASTAWCAVDLLRVARDHSDEMGFNLNDQLFTFGYSQGGHGAMSLHKYVQEELDGEFNMTASYPMSGAYDISGVQAATVINDSTYSSPGYLPYIILGLNQIYNLFDDPIEVFVEPYATLLPPMFDGYTGFGEINQVMPDTPNLILQPAVLDDFINNPESVFRQVFEEQNVFDWSPASPVKMIYCTNDEQVFWQNAIVAHNKFIENGVDPELVEAIDRGHLTHGGCVEPALIGGKLYFDSLIEFDNNIVSGANISYPANGDDGSIELNSSGGEGALSYEWSTGSFGHIVENLASDMYQVTITDETGCSITESYDLTTVSTGEAGIYDLKISPNPATTEVTVILPSDNEKYSAVVRDIMGRVVYTNSGISGRSYQLEVSSFIPGSYFVELQSDSNRYLAKLMVN